VAQEDGRTEPRDADFKKAREELSGVTEDSAPEVPSGDEISPVGAIVRTLPAIGSTLLPRIKTSTSGWSWSKKA
jgi:hypothetical protein